MPNRMSGLHQTVISNFLTWQRYMLNGTWKTSSFCRAESTSTDEFTIKSCHVSFRTLFINIPYLSRPSHLTTAKLKVRLCYWSNHENVCTGLFSSWMAHEILWLSWYHFRSHRFSSDRQMSGVSKALVGRTAPGLCLCDLEKMKIGMLTISLELL